MKFGEYPKMPSGLIVNWEQTFPYWYSFGFRRTAMLHKTKTFLFLTKYQLFQPSNKTDSYWKYQLQKANAILSIHHEAALLDIVTKFQF